MKFLVLYFIIAFVLSVVGTYYDYRSSYFHKSIKSYFNDNFKRREFCRWIESLPYSELITGGME